MDTFIEDIIGREILDSRGNPTVEVDVVVDDAARGKGVGDRLNRFAIDLAARKGAKTVDLTSRPSREAANRLYRRIGFLPRDTNIYRYELG